LKKEVNINIEEIVNSCENLGGALWRNLRS
jgi:hypothetical protein